MCLLFIGPYFWSWAILWLLGHIFLKADGKSKKVSQTAEAYFKLLFVSCLLTFHWPKQVRPCPGSVEQRCTPLYNLSRDREGRKGCETIKQHATAILNVPPVSPVRLLDLQLSFLHSSYRWEDKAKNVFEAYFQEIVYTPFFYILFSHTKEYSLYSRHLPNEKLGVLLLRKKRRLDIGVNDYQSLPQEIYRILWEK